MRTTEEQDEDRRALGMQILGALSLHGKMTYRQIMHAFGARNREVLAALLPLARRRAIRVDTTGGDRGGEFWYMMPENYEWYGATGRRLGCLDQIPRLRMRRCNSRHTSGFYCSRAPGHTGRHVARGVEFALAAWVPGGRYDQAVRLTPEQIAELDRDAADAF